MLADMHTVETNVAKKTIGSYLGKILTLYETQLLKYMLWSTFMQTYGSYSWRPFFLLIHTTNKNSSP